jgi:hypothetical protein
MAADGSRGPRPFSQRRVSTTFLRVPTRDWPAVKRGYKTEFRAPIGGRRGVPQLFSVLTPCCVVAYSIRNDEHDAQLMVLEQQWQEPLGAISPESLAREGFASMAEFRAYWLAREHKRFTPTRQVFAYRLRQFTPADIGPLAGRAFAHLYGEFLQPEDLYPLENPEAA